MNSTNEKSIIYMFGRFLYCLIPVFVSCGAVLFFGKDVNSDALNYHAYAAFGLIEGRIEADFFPAGPQSYLNPVGYIPFYFFRAWLPDLWMALSFATLNSAGIYAIVYLTKEFIKKEDDIYTYYLAILCALLTTVFWQTVGSSFIDGYICALILFGTLYFIRSFHCSSDREQSKSLMFSALFLGAAAGLKLTSIIYCVAAGLTLFVFLWGTPKKWSKLFIFFSFGVVAFTLIEGWWAYLVYARTGNPFFPYLNNIFESPFYPAQSISNDRFSPESWLDGLLFPLYAVMPAPWLYQELRAPDVRFFFFFLFLSVAFLFRWTKLKNNMFGLVAISFYLLSYFFWLISTGNGRYGIHLFLLPGVFIAWFALIIFGKKIAKNIILIVVLVQAVCLWVGASGRYSEQDFSGKWFEYNVPGEFKKNPALFISLDVNSFSFIAESLHPESIFTNLSGQLLLPKTDALDNFLKQAARKFEGNIWFISRATQDALPKDLNENFSGTINANNISSYLYTIDTRLSRLALSVDRSLCFYVSPGKDADFMITPLAIACRVKFDNDSYEKFKLQSVQYDLVFDRIEKECAHLFNPRVSFTENIGDLWGRKYLGSETRMYVSMGSVWIDFSDRVLPLNLGVFSDIQHADAVLNCNNPIPRMSHDVW